MINLLIILGLSIVCGVFYRLGGTSKGTKWRDLGCPALFCLILGLLEGKTMEFWGYMALIPSFGLSLAALTSYRYFLPKPKDYTWVHYSLHGFMVALAMLPFALATGHWLGFALRCLVCTIAIGVWSHFTTKDWLEEWGRGFIFGITVSFLML